MKEKQELSTSNTLTEMQAKNLENATGKKVPPDIRWTDERLAHDEQRRKYKAYIFWAACSICLVLYLAFFGLLWLLATNTLMLQIFLAHNHMMGLALALIIVPSAMLWGLVRAVFRVDPTQQNYADAIKEGIKIHPIY